MTWVFKRFLVTPQKFSSIFAGRSFWCEILRLFWRTPLNFQFFRRSCKSPWKPRIFFGILPKTVSNANIIQGFHKNRLIRCTFLGIFFKIKKRLRKGSNQGVFLKKERLYENVFECLSCCSECEFDRSVLRCTYACRIKCLIPRKKKKKKRKRRVSSEFEDVKHCFSPDRLWIYILILEDPSN